MILIENIRRIEKPLKNAVVTIGNFDGVHKGHQSLLANVIDLARKLNGTSVAMTFDPHPLKALGIKAPPLITLRDQKIELLEKSGIDVLLCLPFDKDFAALSPGAFIEDLLVNKIGMKAIIIGADYSFGKNRAGNIDMLRQEGERLGYQTIVAPWITEASKNSERISSTLIRDIVMDGNVGQAVKYLGRHYQIRGKVVKGRERGGSQLGFPTANLKLHDELCPKIGVYAVTIETSHGTFPGVANIGFSPTFGDQQFTIEAHILDVSMDLYGQRIRINMVERLRDEKKFDSIQQLAEQIRQDIETARKILE